MCILELQVNVIQDGGSNISFWKSFPWRYFSLYPVFNYKILTVLFSVFISVLNPVSDTVVLDIKQNKDTHQVQGQPKTESETDINIPLAGFHKSFTNDDDEKSENEVTDQSQVRICFYLLSVPKIWGLNKNEIIYRSVVRHPEFI